MRDYRKHIWKALTVLGVFLVVGIPQAKAIVWAAPLIIKGVATILTALGVLDFFIGGGVGDTIFGDLLGDAAEEIVRGLAGLANLVIALFGNLLFWIANTTITWATDLNSLISGSPVVKNGFEISLSVANLGLLVGFIVMAIAIMIRADWLVEVRKAIPKFIAAALLINFGFFILTELLINPVNGIFQNVYQAAKLNMETFSGTFQPNLSVVDMAGDQLRLSRIGDEYSDFAQKYLDYIRFREERLGPKIDALLKQYELNPVHFSGVTPIGVEEYTDENGTREIFIYVTPDQRAYVQWGILGTLDWFLEDMNDDPYDNTREEFILTGWGRDENANIDKYFDDRGAPYKVCVEAGNPTCISDFRQLKINIADMISRELSGPYSAVPATDEPDNGVWGFDCPLWSGNEAVYGDHSPACWEGDNDDFSSLALSNIGWQKSSKLPNTEVIVLLLIEVLFNAVLVFLGAFTLLGVALMLMYRYVALSLLIILFPFVWLGWVFPKIATAGGGKNIWNAWWGQFLRWLLFGPIAMFFIYLSASAAVNMDALTQTPGEEFVGKGSMAIVAASFGNAAVVIGLLMGGTMVANKMGIASSGMIMGTIKSSGKWLGKTAMKYTGKSVVAPGKAALRDPRLQKGLDKIRLSKTLERIPGGKYVSSGAARVADYGAGTGKGAVAAAEKKLEGKTEEDLQREYATYSKWKKIAALKRFADTDKLPNNIQMQEDLLDLQLPKGGRAKLETASRLRGELAEIKARKVATQAEMIQKGEDIMAKEDELAKLQPIDRIKGELAAIRSRKVATQAEMIQKGEDIMAKEDELVKAERKAATEGTDRNTEFGRYGLEDTAKKSRKEGWNAETRFAAIQLIKAGKEPPSPERKEKMDQLTEELVQAVKNGLKGVTDAQASLFLKQNSGFFKSFKPNLDKQTGGASSQEAHSAIGRAIRTALLEQKPTALARSKQYMDSDVRSFISDGLQEQYKKTQTAINSALRPVRTRLTGDALGAVDKLDIHANSGTTPATRPQRLEYIQHLRQAAQGSGLSGDALKTVNTEIEKLSKLFEGGSGLDDNIPYASS